jgi:O-antigen/teichoic acid export membrane protein
MSKSTNLVITNFIWRFAERIGAQLVAFVVSIVLARILDPNAYGTVALITVITTILQVFVDSGLGNALIQKKDADNLDFSTVFYTNIAFCSLLYIGLFFAAPFIAEFYKDTALTPYIRVLGLTVLISGIKNVQQAYVSRHMLFKKFFFSTLGGTIIAGIVGVVMALNGAGVWALVAQQVINLAIDTTILWITVKWRPELKFSVERLKGLFNYGWKLLVSSLLDTVYTNIRQLIIGKMYSSADLAQYNRGKQFPNLIVTNVNTSIDSVLLPAMSNEQDNKAHVKAMTRRSIKISTYIMAPLMMGLAFVGEPLVSLVLTDKWLPCVPLMRIFCITFMFYPIHTANLNAIKAMGRSDLFLKLEIWKKIVGIIALLATMWISVEAMAYSLLATSVFTQIINSSPNKKLLGYGYGQQLKDILPGIALAVFMGIFIYPVKFLGLNDFLTLCIQVPLGMCIYLLGSIVFKMDSFTYLWGIVKPFILRKRG